MSRVCEIEIGETGVCETGVGEMGVGKTGPNRCVCVLGYTAMDKPVLRTIGKTSWLL